MFAGPPKAFCSSRGPLYSSGFPTEIICCGSLEFLVKMLLKEEGKKLSCNTIILPTIIFIPTIVLVMLMFLKQLNPLIVEGFVSGE